MHKAKIEGIINKHQVLMYAIGNGLCKGAKKILKNMDVEYEYINIDLSIRKERESLRQDILSQEGNSFIQPLS